MIIVRSRHGIEKLLSDYLKKRGYLSKEQ